MVYQLLSLNVAINSYDHALLTLLVSNQFVEIKGSVFKRFEKDNLFQITCAGNIIISFICPTKTKGHARYRGALFSLSHALCCGIPQPSRA